MILLGQNLYNLCNKNQWFTEGTNEQYEKMFIANDNGSSIDELASIIWLCSDEVSRKDVLLELTEEHQKYIDMLEM